MIQIKFKNLQKSDLVKQVVNERVGQVVEKFNDLSTGKMTVTLEMENSPSQSGLDHFKVKIHIQSGRYRGIIIQKSQANLYGALAEVTDTMLEILNRYGDRLRVKERTYARQIQKRMVG